MLKTNTKDPYHQFTYPDIKLRLISSWALSDNQLKKNKLKMTSQRYQTSNLHPHTPSNQLDKLVGKRGTICKSG